MKRVVQILAMTLGGSGTMMLWAEPHWINVTGVAVILNAFFLAWQATQLLD